MCFNGLQQHLLGAVRERIRNGELTERGLARVLGISQPHIHNILKGVRRLPLGIADNMLRKLDISLLDLMKRDEPRVPDADGKSRTGFES